MDKEDFDSTLTTQETLTHTEDHEEASWRPPFPKYRYTLPFVLLTIGIAAVITNAVTIVAICRFKILRKTVTNILILNLSLTDIISGFTMVGNGCVNILQALKVQSVYNGISSRVLICLIGVARTNSIFCIL